ncbi:MAG: SDR family oxidoreductase [Anaerolineales bacterium]|nr:SDR family oxidoreductase [Anaerolineales bacterium]
MKIVVIGGSGLIGTKLVQKLHMRGHETIAASPSSGVNTITGAGLDKVLMDIEVVIDVTNSRSFGDTAIMNFFETSTRNLLTAEAAANVKHHVILSVAGANRMPDSGYMRAKVAQENLVRSSAKPFAILRATQFFEFLGVIANASTNQDMVRLPPAFVQPVAAVDVAEALADIAVSPPANNIIELAGPERFRLDELIQRYLASIQDPREVTTDPYARYFGAKLDELTLLPTDNARICSTRFEQWLDHDGDVLDTKS